MKRVQLLAVYILMVTALNAQYSPQVSHFMYDQLRTNPGSAGSMDMICATLIARNQMVGFPGAPKAQILEVETPFNLFKAKHGVGISIYGDQRGFFSDIDFSLSYAYRVSIGDGTLGIGIQGGFMKNSIDAQGGWIAPGNNAEPFAITEPNGLTMNLAAGLFYRTEDIYFGVSSINLNNPKIKATSTESTASGEYNLARQFYVTAGYNMQLSNPAYELKPAMLLKSDGVATDMDLNLVVMYNKKFWGGVTYRTGEAIVGMIGFELMEGLKIGYSYDFQTSALTNYSKGGHEVLVNYCFKIGVEKAPQKYKSIRFL